jgi:hypothetical protein
VVLMRSWYDTTTKSWRRKVLCVQACCVVRAARVSVPGLCLRTLVYLLCVPSSHPFASSLGFLLFGFAAANALFLCCCRYYILMLGLDSAGKTVSRMF